MMPLFTRSQRAAVVRLFACAGVVGAAFCGGLGIKRWLMEPTAPAPVSRGLNPVAPGGAKARMRELHPPLTATDFAIAAEALRAAGGSITPQHDILAACEKLLAEARTTADFERLIALFNEATVPQQMEPLMMAAFLRWGTRDPKAAASGVDALRFMHMRLRIADALFSEWTRRDAAAALSFLESAPPGSVRRDGPVAAFRVLAEADPEAAVRRALTWKMEVHPRSVLKAVCEVWVKQDVNPALAFAGRGDEIHRENMLSALVEVAPPERTWQEIPMLPGLSDKQRADLLMRVLDHWGHQIEEPVAAVLALPPGEVRDNLLRRAAEHAAGNGLARGEALLASMPDETTRTQWLKLLAAGAISDKGHARPAETIRLASQLPPGEDQMALIAEAGASWGRLDAPAASHWLTQQPPGGLRDAFTGEFVRGAFASDPAAALTWAANIGDGTLRAARLAELYNAWHQRDLSGAAAWLEQSGLSEQDQRSAMAGPPDREPKSRK
jgi:hypothetical protein